MQRKTYTQKILGSLLLAAAAFTAPLSGQTCIPQGFGVPGNSGPPHWWDNVPVQNAGYMRQDDARWVGAGSVTFGDGTSNLMEFRALNDPTNLYFSWRIRHVVVGLTDNSILYFSFPRSVADGGGVLVVSVNLKHNNVQEDQPQGFTFDLKAYTRNAGNGQGTLIAAPAWLTNTIRAWVNSPDANTWGVEVQVPRASVAFTGATFPMWFDLQTATLTNPVVEIAEPSAAVLTYNGQEPVYPDPTAGGSGQSFSTDAGCTGGISIAWDHIGTENADPHTINLNSPNVFFARPMNGTGSLVSMNSILARFRIANWGSMISDPNAPWTTIPGGDMRPNTGDIAAGTTATAANECKFTWTLTAGEKANYQNGTYLPHQCILVDLSNGGGGSLTFLNNSVSRNMDFVNASKFEREAEISIKGLTPVAPDGRDVYVWVETLNMPKQAPPGGPPQLRTIIPAPPPPPNPTGGNELGVLVNNQRQNPEPPREGPTVPLPDGAGLQKLLADGQTTPELIMQVAPVYIVHVYHDTGRTAKSGGTDRPVLAPQGAFGYFVSHAGSLYGWESTLVGKGFALETLADNFYRIKKVPNDGTVRVITTILARESAPWPWWWWIVLVIILVLILLWLLLRRK